MVMSNLLLSMMSKNKLIVGMMMLLCLLSCGNNEEEVLKKTTLKGNVTTYSNFDDLGGFEVRLIEYNKNESFEYVAYTDKNGAFTFDDIAVGTHELYVSKENFKWSLMVVNDKPNHTDHKITLIDKAVNSVRVLMSNKLPVGGNDELVIRDLNGNLLNKIVLTKGMESFSFMIYNFTGKEHYYSVDDLGCYSLADDGMGLVYMFKDVFPREGRLDPGQNVAVVCTIDTDIYDEGMTVYHDACIDISWGLLWIRIPIECKE